MCRERDSRGHWGAQLRGGQAMVNRCNNRASMTRRPLYCLSDRNGFWQPWGKSMATGRRLPAGVPTTPAPWQLGTCTWLALGPKATWPAVFKEGFRATGAAS